MEFKKIVLWLVIIMVVSFGVAGATLGTYFHPGFWQQQTTTVSDEKMLAVQDINKIVIKCASAEVKIVPTNEPTGKASLQAVSLAKKQAAPTLDVQVSNGVLTVEVIYQPKLTVGFGSLNQTLEVTIPAQYAGDLSVEVMSGDTAMNDFKLNNFSYNGASSTLNVDNVATKSTFINVMSGSVKLNGFSGDLAIDTASGSTKVEYLEFNNNNVNISAMSGEVTLKLPASAQFSLEAKAMSGNVDCSFPVTFQGTSIRNQIKGKVGQGTGAVTISTASGNIRIRN